MKEEGRYFEQRQEGKDAQKKQTVIILISVLQRELVI
jgi:hypothetical protein